MSLATIDAATICLINQQRAAHHLRPLRASGPLAQVASEYAAYMVSRDRFGHVDSLGQNVLGRVAHADPAFAHRMRLVGENLGWGTYQFATPRSMVAGWMASPEHRANILSRIFRLVGVGVANGAPVSGVRGALTYTTVFGRMR